MNEYSLAKVQLNIRGPKAFSVTSRNNHTIPNVNRQKRKLPKLELIRGAGIGSIRHDGEDRGCSRDVML